MELSGMKAALTLEKLRAEFDDYDDRSLKVKHYCICGEWFATAGDPLTIVNIKGISTHRQKYHVQNVLLDSFTVRPLIACLRR